MYAMYSFWFPNFIPKLFMHSFLMQWPINMLNSHEDMGRSYLTSCFILNLTVTTPVIDTLDILQNCIGYL